MFSNTSSSTKAFQLLLVTLFLVVLPFVVLAEEPNHTMARDSSHQEHRQPSHGCQQDKDCGDNAHCNIQTGRCTCPSPEKEYIEIPEAKPMCQKISKIGESCKYNVQCTESSGNYSRCQNSKCECHDTVKNRDVVRLYRGICYVATAVNHTCATTLECQASIEPEEHIRCNPTTTPEGRRKNICVCDEGQECKEKSGASLLSPVALSSFATFTLLGIMATKIVA